MVVAVAGVRQAPGDERVVLAVGRIAGPAVGAGADAALGAGGRPAHAPVLVRVAQLLRGAAVL